MGYPYGPPQGHDPYAGQGYAQPGYAPDPYGGQPGYAQPYGAPVQNGYGAPAYGSAPYPGYGMPGYGPPRAGGGTAITAALISLLMALVALGGLGIGVAFLLGTDATSATDEDGRTGMAIAMAIGAVPCLLWLLGSILLFRRKTAGRVIIILMSSLALIYCVVSMAITLPREKGDDVLFTLIGGVAVGAIPLLLLALAAAPSTGRWIREGRQGAYPYQGY
ncbi:hypothetical protein [Nocardia fluminea]|uniref:hypothetical protein n=1 Tax=Nocardia fluminea TaxID=134984 RepID=UPI00342C2B97